MLNTNIDQSSKAFMRDLVRPIHSIKNAYKYFTFESGKLMLEQNISLHIENILKEGELDPNRTVKDFLTVRQEGNRQVQRNIVHYNLDMIIALGYRIQSQVAVRFRRHCVHKPYRTYLFVGFAQVCRGCGEQGCRDERMRC